MSVQSAHPPEKPAITGAGTRGPGSGYFGPDRLAVRAEVDADNAKDAEIARLTAELATARKEIASAEAHMAARWPRCPDGCGCRMDGQHADVRDCACDGPCTAECRENGYPDAPSYRDLAVKHVTAERDQAREELAGRDEANGRLEAERDGAWADLDGMTRAAAEYRTALAKAVAERDRLERDWNAERDRRLEYGVALEAIRGTIRSALELRDRNVLPGMARAVEGRAREALEGGGDDRG